MQGRFPRSSTKVQKEIRDFGPIVRCFCLFRTTDFYRYMNRPGTLLRATLNS